MPAHTRRRRWWSAPPRVGRGEPAARPGARPLRRVGWVVVGLLIVLLGAGLALVWPDPGPIVGFATVGRDPFPVVLDDRTHRAFVYNRGDGTVTTIDTLSGTAVRTVAVGSQYALLAVDQRTSRVFVSGSGGDDIITMLDARSGRVLHQEASAADPTVRWVAVDEISNHVFVGHRDIGMVTMLDARTGHILRRVPVCASPFAIAVAARARHVFVQCIDGTLSMLDARSGRVLRTTTTGNGFSTLLADDTTGRVFDMDATQVVVLDARTAAVVRTTPHLPTIGWPVADPRTGRVFVSLAGQASGAGPRAPVVELDGRTGAVLRQFAIADNPDPVAVDPRTGHLLVGSAGPLDGSNQPRGYGMLSVVDPASGAVLRRVPLGVFPAAMALDARAGRLVVDNETTDLNILPSGFSGPLTTSPPEDRWRQLKRYALGTLKRLLPSWLPFSVTVPPAPAPPTNGTMTTLDLTRL